MASLLNPMPLVGAVRRNWTMLNPAAVPKAEKPLKFGVLGAANIVPFALITPAKTHPEVVIHAVAARDREKATVFAKTHGIPVVLDSYQAILDDPDIDAVYVPLPNGLHFEWALKALAGGKHVLLEKPSTSNSEEAGILFNSPLLKQPDAPILMEAFHNRFTPAWRCFMAQLDRPSIAKVRAVAAAPGMAFSKDDIRFSYDLAGGAMMDLGTYPIAAVRGVFGAEPEACLESELEPMPAPHDRCDGNFKVKFQFPGGGVAEVEGGLRVPLVKNMGLPLRNWVQVTHRPVIVESPDEKLRDGEVMTRQRNVVLVNFMLSNFYHRIDIEDEFIVTTKGDPSKVLRKFTKKETKKAYAFRNMNIDQPGEEHWQTYRYMLEAFVNRIRGRRGTGAWVDHDDSIGQMKAMDMAYEKSGLGPRPTSKYRPDTV